MRARGSVIWVGYGMRVTLFVCTCFYFYWIFHSGRSSILIICSYVEGMQYSSGFEGFIYDRFWCHFFGMNWLFSYHTILNGHANKITLVMPRIHTIKWRVFLSHSLKGWYHLLMAHRLMEKGYLACLACIWYTSVKTLVFRSILMVSEFLEVFLSDLPSLPHDCDIDFVLT